MTRSRGLRIAADLTLDPDYVTKTAAILAQRRVGKTYAASVIAEEMVALQQPFVALDPTGAWWGLRASADGHGPGLPVVILGGLHGDLPLERDAGAFVADLVVDQPNFYVLDFKLFPSREAERSFATAFAERLYRRKATADFPLHLFVDEADMFAPQQSREDEKRMLGAFEAIVRRGGLSGLGTTLISQRSAVVNKNVLEQIDILIALRTVGPNDRKRIDEIISGKAEPEQRNTLLGSLASLEKGDAWVWEPGGLPPLFQRVHIRERRTFNSSATPKPGEHRMVPTQLAPVDLEQLRVRMAETLERAEADNPVRLRRRIAELERAQARGVAPPTVVEKTVEVSVLTPEDRQEIASLGGVIPHTVEMLRGFVDRLDRTADKLARIAERPTKAPPRPLPTRSPARAPSRPADAAPPPSASAGSVMVTTPQQRILDALARLEAMRIGEPNKTQVALVSGVSPRSSGFVNNLGALRSAGLITYPQAGRVSLSEVGRARATPGDQPVSTLDVQTQVARLVGGPKWRLLDVLIQRYPEPVEKNQLAELAGVSPRSSGFVNNLGALRSWGFLDYPSPGYVVAQPVLFLEGAA